MAKSKIKNSIFVFTVILITTAGAVAAQNAEESDFIFAKKAFSDGFYDIAQGYGWLDHFDEVQAQIASHVVEDTNKPYTNHYVSYYQGAMRDFIAQRESMIEYYLGPR